MGRRVRGGMREWGWVGWWGERKRIVGEDWDRSVGGWEVGMVINGRLDD